MGYPVNHKRIREKYNPEPNAAERRHHARVMQDGCLVCGGPAVVHHVLQNTPNKRWRRDHKIVVPLCDPHHRELHNHGNEAEWQKPHGLDLVWEAETRRNESIYEGIL